MLRKAMFCVSVHAMAAKHRVRMQAMFECFERATLKSVTCVNTESLGCQ